MLKSFILLSIGFSPKFKFTENPLRGNVCRWNRELDTEHILVFGQD